MAVGWGLGIGGGRWGECRKRSGSGAAGRIGFPALSCWGAGLRGGQNAEEKEKEYEQEYGEDEDYEEDQDEDWRPRPERRLLPVLILFVLVILILVLLVILLRIPIPFCYFCADSCPRSSVL
jgi:hypothetical protein